MDFRNEKEKMKSKTHTGGEKEFVGDGKPLGDTQSTSDFKEGLKEWYNKPKIFRKFPSIKLILKYSGLTLIAMGLTFYNMNNAKFVIGFGLFLFAVSLMVRGKKK